MARKLVLARKGAKGGKRAGGCPWKLRGRQRTVKDITSFGLALFVRVGSGTYNVGR